jgi:hypothetical protein
VQLMEPLARLPTKSADLVRCHGDVPSQQPAGTGWPTVLWKLLQALLWAVNGWCRHNSTHSPAPKNFRSQSGAKVLDSPRMQELDEH